MGGKMKYVQRCPKCGDTEIEKDTMFSGLSRKEKLLLERLLSENEGKVTEVALELKYECVGCDGPIENSTRFNVLLSGSSN